jgi:hypothetical protein
MLLDWCGVWIGMGMAVGVGKIREVVRRTGVGKIIGNFMWY